LLLSKNSSIEASQGIQQFASALQQSTRFGDEVILQNAALIQSLGDLDSNGLKRATQAAADLATVLRVDLGSAATLVGKAAAGEVGSFSRYGLAIQKGASNAETFANALAAIEAKFGGAAQRDVLTYSGSVDQLSNAFGDLLEEFGKIITQNPSVVAAIKSTTNLIVSASGQVAQFAKSFNIFEVIANSLIAFNDAVITYVVSPLELAVNIGNVFFSAINSATATSIAIIGQLGGVIGNLLSKLGVMNQLSQGLQDFAETSKQTALEVNAGLTSAINNIGSFPLSDNLSQRNEELRQFFVDAFEIFTGKIDSTRTSFIEDIYENKSSEVIDFLRVVSDNERLSVGMLHLSINTNKFLLKAIKSGLISEYHFKAIQYKDKKIYPTPL
jgi:hypothetical protein